MVTTTCPYLTLALAQVLVLVLLWSTEGAKYTPSSSASSSVWSKLIDKPGTYSLFYPKVKLTSWLDQVEAAEDDEDFTESQKKDLFYQIQQKLLTFTTQRHKQTKQWKHSYDLPSDSIVEEVSQPEDIDLQHLVVRGLSSLQLVKDKYKKLLVVPIVKTIKSRRILDEFVNAMVLSLPSWPFGWKHFTFSSQYHVEGSSEDDHDHTAILEIQLFESKSSKTRMKLIVGITLRDGGLFIDGTEVSYEGMKRAESELMASTILQFVKQSLRDQYNIRKVRKHQQRQYKSEADVFQAAEKKKALDRIINPDKYKTKAATVRRAGDGNGRYKPGAATQARRQVRSK